MLKIQTKPIFRATRTNKAGVKGIFLCVLLGRMHYYIRALYFSHLFLDKTQHTKNTTNSPGNNIVNICVKRATILIPRHNHVSQSRPFVDSEQDSRGTGVGKPDQTGEILVISGMFPNMNGCLPPKAYPGNCKWTSVSSCRAHPRNVVLI